MMGTWEKRKIPLPLLPKKKKTVPLYESVLSLSLAVWNFYFPKLFAPFLAWANGMATPLKEKKEKIPPNPITQKEKTGPSLVHAEPLMGCMQILFLNLAGK
jgi:hypothetical protein